MQPLEQDVQRGCVVSALGDFQNQVGQSPQQQPMKSKLTHPWAGVCTGVLPRRALKYKWLHTYAMKIKYQYMNLKPLYIHVYIFIVCCFSFWVFFSSSNIYIHKDICSFAFFPVSDVWSGLQPPELHLKYSSQILFNFSSNFIQYFKFCTFDLFAKTSLSFCCPVVVWLPF